ncbi:hypothetical protein BC349_03085 [Flavihumibacter stibioxidans]|uniref:CCDC81-like prokaryotic HU domain-containing protein n=2 Tax=Flavihumibacter stibioxidans TaxID=1834163 RepID=A0ABR7M4L5_9BACT|nr:hypothetical protein [Flavihumibacter stibioxidans]
MEGTTIQFDNKADAAISNDLIEYVRTHTGKMHSLALSDIESYIMLNKQFLNIGKALYMEGIGTLVKTKEGSFDFTAGDMVAERMDDISTESRKPSAFDDDPRYQPQSNGSRKWLLALGALATIGIVVWGGWKLFQNNPQEPEQAAAEQVVNPPAADTLVMVAPDSALQLRKDSLAILGTDSSGSKGVSGSSLVSVAGNWKFIIEETTNKARAFRRYNQLKELKKNILMETQDSIKFRLYFSLPASASDTARIKDSLRIFYASKVKVEQL